MIALKDGLEAKVDTRDYSALQADLWFAHSGYARKGSRPFFMHRMVMERMLGRQMSGYEFVDHKNHHTLDNRRANLRLASDTNNHANQRLRSNNSSGYKGVSYSGRTKERPWAARIGLDGRAWHIGSFSTAEEAAYAYDQWALQLFGEFAHTNLQLM